MLSGPLFSFSGKEEASPQGCPCLALRHSLCCPSERPKRADSPRRISKKSQHSPHTQSVCSRPRRLLARTSTRVSLCGVCARLYECPCISATLWSCILRAPESSSSVAPSPVSCLFVSVGICMHPCLYTWVVAQLQLKAVVPSRCACLLLPDALLRPRNENGRRATLPRPLCCRGPSVHLAFPPSVHRARSRGVLPVAFLTIHVCHCLSTCRYGFFLDPSRSQSFDLWLYTATRLVACLWLVI